MKNEIVGTSNRLIIDLKQLIEEAKQKAATYVNSSLVLLYWHIGNKINAEILKEERAEYGEKIIKQVAEHLTVTYNKGFDSRALFRMVKFARTYPEEQIVVTLSPLLSWSHFIELITFDDPLKRHFYAEMCRLEHWSVRELRKKIDGMLYERTAISKAPPKLIKQELQDLQKHNKLTKNLTFRDPYILDFLELPDVFSENDLENAILNDLCLFLQELGTDFCFLARQKRITIDNEDYYIDLLTYHRGLRRMIAIELKLGRFVASYKGQIELYLKWLNKYERREGEEAPLGLILCAEKKQEHIELLELDKSGIHVAQYLTQLPPREILEARLRNAIEVAQEKHAQFTKKEDGDDGAE